MGTVRYTTINGEVIAQKRDGVRRQFVPDPLGSTVAMLDSTQTITDTFSYWPYGEVANRTGTTEAPFQFIGTRGYYADDLDKYYVRARFYRPALTVWQSRDQLWPRESAYHYVNSMPTSETDPSGTQTASQCDCYYGLITGLRPTSPFGACMRCNHGRGCASLPTTPLGPAAIAGIKSIINAQGEDTIVSHEIADQIRPILVGLGLATDNISGCVNSCTDKCEAIINGKPNFTKCDKMQGFLACVHSLPQIPTQGWAPH